MPNIRYDRDADLTLLKNTCVAIVGYGSQGHAHALNLRDSGVEVVVGLREGSRSRAHAEEAGFDVLRVSEAAKRADLVMMLCPDTVQGVVFAEEVLPHLEAGNALFFAHGFNLRYEQIAPPAHVDVALVAPKGPGHRVRETFVEGGGVPALLAVHQDATGKADALALAYASAIGAGRAGVLCTTVAEETETDLFGEQAVLCGGVSELVKAGFETLTEAGYQPEVAYFECLHELKLIVDLMYRGGLSYMRYSVSDTAEFGDYHAGRKVISDDTRAAMKAVLRDIQDGSFARTWVTEHQAGSQEFHRRRGQEREHPLELVGKRLRSMMPFVAPVDPTKGEDA